MDSPSRKSTEEKLQHSGDLGLEKPEVIFGSTKLPEAYAEHLTNDKGEVIVPDNIEALGNQQPPINADSLKRTSEHEAPKKGFKGRLLVIGGAVVATLTAGALAIGLNLPKSDDAGTPPPESNSNGSGQVVDDPEAETPAEPQTPELITSLEPTEWQTFQAAPRAEQVAYVDYGLDLNVDAHNILVEGKDRTTWTEPSRDMTGQQIVDNFNYVRDDAGFTLMIDTEGNKVLDKNEAIKKLSGAYYDTGSVIVTNAFLADRDLINAQERGFITGQKQTVISESEILEGDDQNGDPIEYKEITFVDDLDTTHTAEYVYVEYETVDNEQASTWLLYQQHLTE